jgi:hypothetical protein
MIVLIHICGQQNYAGVKGVLSDTHHAQVSIDLVKAIIYSYMPVDGPNKT